MVAYAGSIMSARTAALPSGQNMRALHAGAAAGVVLWPAYVDAFGHCTGETCHEHLSWSSNQSASLCTSPCSAGAQASDCSQATCSGAAFFVEGATLEVFDSSFDSNIATNGGAIYWSGDDYSVFECSIARSNFTIASSKRDC